MTAVPTVPVPLPDLLAIAAGLERDGKLDEASRLLTPALPFAADMPDVQHLAGILAFRRKQEAEGLRLMERAVALDPANPLFLRNIAEIYRTQGRLDEAIAAARRATGLAPDDALAWHNLALVHYARLEPADAEAAARHALELQPQMPGAHFELAEALLLQGRLAEGWEEYEWRFRLPGVKPPLPDTDRPQWDGAPPAGTLLLVADQGFGDIIQFARYIPWVQTQAPDIAIAASAEIIPLLRQLAPGVPIFQTWADCPPYAAWCPLSGLPRLHGTRLETIPADIPYLRADPARRAHWRDRLAALAPAGWRRIAIAWAGRPTHNNDRNRSTTLASFAPLADLRATVLVSIQKGDAAGQGGAFFGRAPLINLGGEIADYDDTMAILDAVDLLVAVDTSVVHLAGAMGRPAWVMLPHAPDWRWLTERNDTPWYPSLRLWRKSPGDSYADLARRMAKVLRDRHGGDTV